jgi:FkbM family methyltransferase
MPIENQNTGDDNMFNEREFIVKIIKDQILTVASDYSDHRRRSKYETAAELFWDSCMTDDGALTLGRMRFPDIRWFFGWMTFPCIYADTILLHQFYNDEYTLENSNMIENEISCEGPYFLDEVIIKKGDVAIDAGAYIGDWAALAAVLGGDVYAFEPSPMCYRICQDTAMLNKFQVIKEGLGETVSEKAINLKFPAGDFVTDTGDIPCHINTIDNFAENRGIHVDFIKSDIEGFERQLLRGASRTLLIDEPKLAIRTYHYPDDPQVLQDIVSKINPRYKFKHTRHTMFATTQRGAL